MMERSRWMPWLAPPLVSISCVFPVGLSCREGSACRRVTIVGTGTGRCAKRTCAKWNCKSPIDALMQCRLLSAICSAFAVGHELTTWCCSVGQSAKVLRDFCPSCGSGVRSSSYKARHIARSLPVIRTRIIPRLRNQTAAASLLSMISTRPFSSDGRRSARNLLVVKNGHNCKAVCLPDRLAKKKGRGLPRKLAHVGSPCRAKVYWL